MIEIIRLDGHPVRVTGFTRIEPGEHPRFDVVVQIPGDAANREFEQIIRPSPLRLTICHPDGDEETHTITITAHDIHRAGPAHAPLYRHQFRFEQIARQQPPLLNPIESELAEIITRLDRLLNALDDAGVISRAAMEHQARNIHTDGTGA